VSHGHSRPASTRMTPTVMRKRAMGVPCRNIYQPAPNRATPGYDGGCGPGPANEANR
jgi:hypothetical protein